MVGCGIGGLIVGCGIENLIVGASGPACSCRPRAEGIIAGTSGAHGSSVAGVEAIVLRTGATGGGTSPFRGAAAAAGAGSAGLVGPTEKINPWFCGSNGLLTPSGTSTCRCTRRRVIKAGLSWLRISANGRGTKTRSRSFAGEKSCGIARRNSPKEILTAPRESWERIFSSGIEIVDSPTSMRLTRGWSSSGSPLSTARSDNCTLLA